MLVGGYGAIGLVFIGADTIHTYAPVYLQRQLAIFGCEAAAGWWAYLKLQERLKRSQEADRRSHQSEEARTRYIPAVVKQAVWSRDGGKCVECGSKTDIQYDHEIPHSLGGANTVENIRLLCMRCNLRKSDTIM